VRSGTGAEAAAGAAMISESGACGDRARVLQVDRSGMCDVESDCAVFYVFKPCARILWFWGLNNNNLVKSLHFPQALTGLLPGSCAREQARKDKQNPLSSS
jgi:hypothetical protein